MSQHASMGSSLSGMFQTQSYYPASSAVYEVVLDVNNNHREITASSSVKKIGQALNNRKNRFLMDMGGLCDGIKSTCNFVGAFSQIFAIVTYSQLKNAIAYPNESEIDNSANCQDQLIPKISSVAHRAVNPIETIPPEILNEIVGYLSLQEIMVCQLVCKKWREVIVDPSFLLNFLAEKPQFPELFLKKITTTSLQAENHFKTTLKSKEVYKLLLNTAIILGNVSFLKNSFAVAARTIDKWNLVPEAIRTQWMLRCNALIRYLRSHGVNYQMLNELQNEIGFDVGIMNRFHHYEHHTDYSSGREYSSLGEFDSSTASNVRSGPQSLTLVSTIFVIVPNLYYGYQSVSSLLREYPQRKNAEWLKTLSLPSKVQQDPLLSQYKCQSSGRVPLIPVRDRCGHLFDYVVIKYSSAICPTSNLPIVLADVKFDARVARRIQRQFQKVVKEATLLEFFSKKGKLFDTIQKTHLFRAS